MHSRFLSSADNIVTRNMAFWRRTPSTRPLVTFRIGHDCAFEQFQTSQYLCNRQDIAPEEIEPERFLPDYERMIHEAEQVERDLFWGLEPFFGIPWINMILGCRLDVTDSVSWCHPPAETPQEWLKRPIQLNTDPWFRKLEEFTRLLIRFSAGRYPIGQPLLRGPADLLAAIVGDSNAILGLVTKPDLFHAILDKCTDLFIELMHALHRIHTPFQKGWIVGYYNVWAPQPACRFQEDNATLYSPDLYRTALRRCDEKLSATFSYNVLHLHSDAMFLLDHILNIPTLRCVEVDVDFEAHIPDLIPALQKIQSAGKCLIIDGFIGWSMLSLLLNQIDPSGTLYHLRAQTVEAAQTLNEQFRDRFKFQ